MAEVVQSKLKLLYLKDIFEKETDEEHGLSVVDIVGKLAELGINVERKTVYRDNESLRAYGLDIVKDCDHRPDVYKLVDRNFSNEELFLMADAVQSSRFLAKKWSDDLVRKIAKLGSAHMSDGLKKRIDVNRRSHTENKQVLLSLDELQRAMNDGRKVEYTYFKYDVNGKRAARNNGEKYLRTPVHLMYMDDEYYLIAYDDDAVNADGEKGDFRTYRVDRMEGVQEVADEPATKNDKIKKFDPGKFQERVFGMYGDETFEATLLCKENAVNIVIDRFGKSVLQRAVPTNDGRMKVKVKVMAAPTFYGWLAIMGNDVLLDGPEELVAGYKRHLNSILDQYK